MPVRIEVNGQEVFCETGRPALNELLRHGYVVATACGGRGICHLCRVTVTTHDKVPPPNATEKRALGNVLLRAGLRLSCQIQVSDGLGLRVEPPRSRP